MTVELSSYRYSQYAPVLGVQNKRVFLLVNSLAGAEALRFAPPLVIRLSESLFFLTLDLFALSGFYSIFYTEVATD